MWMLILVVLMAERTLGEEVAEDARGRSCKPFNRVDDMMDEIKGQLEPYLNYCPELDTSAHLPDHAHSYGGGRREGYEVHFKCNELEGYAACGSSTAICGKDGQWRVEGDMFCFDESETIWADVVKSTIYTFPCAPSTETKLVLTGKPKWRKTFDFDIFDADGNIVLHNTIRMQDSGHVIDTLIGSNWKSSKFVDFNFRTGVNFVLEVIWAESGFQVIVDGEVKYKDYPYYGGNPSGWRLKGDYETASVTYNLP